jgi:hypothetical protein
MVQSRWWIAAMLAGISCKQPDRVGGRGGVIRQRMLAQVDPDRVHADSVRTLDVVDQVVADVDALARCGAGLCQRGLEHVRRRLSDAHVRRTEAE